MKSGFMRKRCWLSSEITEENNEMRRRDENDLVALSIALYNTGPGGCSRSILLVGIYRLCVCSGVTRTHES